MEAALSGSSPPSLWAFKHKMETCWSELPQRDSGFQGMAWTTVYPSHPPALKLCVFLINSHVGDGEDIRAVA